MQTAKFTNFTTEEFIGYWDGKPKKFKPGQSEYMPDYKARHYAKHLVNRELLRTNADGNLIYKNGDKFTSPKRMEDVPVFVELFNKAYTPEDDNEDLNTDDLEVAGDVLNRNHSQVIETTTEGVTGEGIELELSDEFKNEDE